MCYSETTVTADDATRLFVRHYGARIPADADGRWAARNVIIVHGGFEHGERYDHLARWMAHRGWEVLVPDLRGHGRSGGVPVHVRSFGEYVRDIEAIRREFALEPAATALFGHSTGALIGLRYCQVLPGRVAALALTSPLLGMRVRVSPFTVAFGRVLSSVAPKARFRSPLKPQDATRNQQVIESRLRDPLFHRSLTASWYFAMKSALRNVWQEADKVDLPIFLLQAGEDRLVDPVAAEEWLASAGSSDKTYRLLPDQFHELHHEPNWQETAADVVAWLEARIRPPSSPIGNGGGGEGISEPVAWRPTRGHF